MTTKRVLAAAMALVLATLAAPVGAKGLPPTHGALLDSLAHRVADELLAGVSIPPGRPVTLERPIAGDTLGVLGQSLLERLQNRGVPVRLLAPAGPGSAGAAAGTAAAAGTPTAAGTSGAADSAAARPADPVSASASLLLSVRVAASGVSYTRALHGFPARVTGYERLAYLRASATLLDGPSRSVVWTRSASEEARDRVGKGDLDYVSTGSGGINPARPAGGGFRFLEPAIVLGVVAGLVVLFYSNRN